MSVCLEPASQHLKFVIVFWIFLNQIPDNFSWRVPVSTATSLRTTYLCFSPRENALKFNRKNEIKKRCVEIEKNIREACSYCKDQSYLRFLFQQARKSKQSVLSKSEKSLAKWNATFVSTNGAIGNYQCKLSIRNYPTEILLVHLKQAALNLQHLTTLTTE